MNTLIYFLQKTIGQKIVVGLTGLGLALFLLIHMIGNLFILSGPAAYNRYAYKLHELPIFFLLEIGLLLVFLGHILLSLLLQIKNKKARGETEYKLKAKGDKKTDLAHRFLWFQGIILLLFLAFHLISFKFGPIYETQLDGKTVRNIYQLVMENFKKPLYTIGYTCILGILFVHLFRGLPASFKSLGLSNPFYLSLIKTLSISLSIIIVVGFLAPIWYIFIYYNFLIFYI
ncbi:MAG: succinate dehydrogenase cytochrome b subunit [Bdellovibrionaceae bacterium]|nr:succinate dehydrogenase cytochrome b subunit [Pseudobdellovibrionaceae bacterium]